MQEVFFYIFAVLTLLCGALVIFNPFTRSPVTSAMFLVLTIVSMAGLFVLLHAFFLAAVQVLVYAGAVIVLFLFVIMLLDLKEEEQRKIKGSMAALGIFAVGVIASVMIATIRQSRLGFGAKASLTEGSTVALGQSLFGNFALPFEIISLVLLVAMIGAVLLSKKDLK
ncbi:MAG TPA: NADH-quinone oxidoreductase subunit J [Verrucomicrobiae bacterium]|jgi:NADH-quinone oxidoreductase subunit J|nr:NADH-quinone oxidoreductase subunit J [Verrucomicrobiae bacterium]